MSKNREEWTEEEDTKLIQLVKAQQLKFGKKDHEAFKANWKDIAKEMKTRTVGGCQGRWTVHLDPTVDRSPWTPALDKRLLELYKSKEHNSWSKRAKVLAEGKFTPEGFPMRRGGGDTCERYFYLKKHMDKGKDDDNEQKNEIVEVKVEKVRIKRESEVKIEEAVDESNNNNNSSSGGSASKKSKKAK